MAFGAIQKNPIDLKPSTAVGVSLPFNGAAVFRPTYTTKDALKYNLVNFFLTNQGDRFLNPNFGANLRAYLFEQITTGNLDYIKEDIQKKINIYFPSVAVDEISVYQQPTNTDTNQILVTIKYSIVGLGVTDELLIIL